MKVLQGGNNFGQSGFVKQGVSGTAAQRPQTSGSMPRHLQTNQYRQDQNTHSMGVLNRRKGNNGRIQSGFGGGTAINFSGIQKRTVGSNPQMNQTASNIARVVDPSQVKEMMNTSAPICISNFINQGRPQTKGTSGARRQQYGHQQYFTGVRKGTQGRVQAGPGLGIVSGQTMNLSRAQTRDGGQRNNLLSQQTQPDTAHGSILGTANSVDPKQRHLTGQFDEGDFMNRGARIAEKIQEANGPVANRADLQSQGGARTTQNGSIREQVGGLQNRPRAVSAYNNNANPRRQGAQNNMGAHQKQVIGSMKERQMQMRVIGAHSTKNTLEQQVQRGYQQQRPVSRDSRLRGNNAGFYGSNVTTVHTDGPSNMSGKKVNNFFAMKTRPSENNGSAVPIQKTIPVLGQGLSINSSSTVNAASKRLNQENDPESQQVKLQQVLRQSATGGEVLKVSDLMNGSQEKNIATMTMDGNTRRSTGNQELEGVTSSDIRQIKLNYLQLNKRQTGLTASQTQQPQSTANTKGRAIAKAKHVSQKAGGQTEYNYASSPDCFTTGKNSNGPQGQYKFEIERPLAGQAVEKKEKATKLDEILKGGEKVTTPAQAYDRHPLDKTHIYKSEGGPVDPEQIEFCTPNSTIENLDNYIIGRRLGQGAYAVVRLGLHKALNQKIAVKIYEKFKLLEPNRRKSVKREMKIMEKLDHPNIAKLYEAFESHKQVFLIMEYVNGGSLHGYLKMKPNRQMPEIEAKFLWRQVVQALYYCHQRNVSHRDIKLENLLLDETKTVVKLIDFGFSTCIPHERKVKLFCGTPSYMAPEIVSKTEYSGPPADVWALGVLLYALLCGKFPFRGSNDKELYQAICKQELQFPDHVSQSARQFLNKLFRKEADKRLTTKQILKDPWCEFSQQEYDLVSPRHTLGFANNTDLLNYERVSSLHNTQKVSGGRPQTQGKPGQRGDNPLVLNPQQINFAQGTGSKDKRLTMFPEQIKRYVIQTNAQKVEDQNDKSSKSEIKPGTEKSQAYQSLNQTQPVASRKSFTDKTTTASGKPINMEAYQAYYNTDEGESSTVNKPVSTPPAETSGNNTNIINNIMHINAKGANINITAMPNTQNNFIFNHTAPINLNFYKDQQKSGESTSELVDQQVIEQLQTQLDLKQNDIKAALKDPESDVYKHYQKLIEEKLKAS